MKSWSSERKRKSGVTSIDISMNDDMMAVAFSDNDVATFNLSKVIPQINEGLEIMKRNLRNMEKKVKFEYVFGGSHYGEIISMDICV